MWNKIKQRLGKVVQGVLNIFGKKKSKKETIIMKTNGFTDENGITFGPGTITLVPTERYKEQPITIYWEDDSITQLDKDLYTELNLSEEEVHEELLKMLSTPKQDLPKRYWCETLLISIYANWEYSGFGVDLSQLEEEGIAHYMIFDIRSMEDAIEDFCEREGCEIWEEDESVTIGLRNATLIDWGNGLWTWRQD